MRFLPENGRNRRRKIRHIRKGRKNLNTKELLYFKTVYEEKSINQAAKKLYITSQGLGRNIRALETEFQVKLFERTKKGVEPTPYAELLYKKTGTLIQQLEELSAEFAKLKSGGEKFRIGLSYGILKIFSMRVILEFIRENPQFQIEWKEYHNDEVKDMVLSSDLDYGFIVGECDFGELIQRKIMSRKIMLLVYKDHPFYDLDEVELDMLKEEKILTMDEDFHIYHVFGEACRKRGVYPQIADKTDNGAVLYRLCEEKQGVAPIMDFTTDIYKTEGVREIPLKEDLRWDVTSIYRKGKQEYEAIQKFEAHLKKYFP